MSIKKTIELLAPAKNAQIGKEAILHGADAVYIGAPKFSARAAAGNDINELEDLIVFAHAYHAKVYVAVNTLIFEEELAEVQMLIHELWRIGADALIVQDMGITMLDLPPIPLHASTQTDNRTVEKVQFLQDAGFEQVVLARELSLDEIRLIASKTNVALEAFIHGALCVSYSGQCYISQALSGRSANRGECSQYCRMFYDLVDSDDKVLVRQKHLLSLKDLNRTDSLESLLDAGVTSFKIEGRLKDANYVKNTVAWYRAKLDRILARKPDFVRSSQGISRITFKPDLFKSFNRSFTPYFIHGRKEKTGNPDTPKSMGEPVGKVKEIRGNSFTVAGLAAFTNGDGLSFIGKNGQYEGFRVNRVEGNRLFPARMPELTPGMALNRTQDQAFEKELEKQSATRVIPVTIGCREIPCGFALDMEDVYGNRVSATLDVEKVPASKPQAEQVKIQMAKLGNTRYEAMEVQVCWSRDWFVPVSVWAEQRRLLCEKMDLVRRLAYRRREHQWSQTTHPYIQNELSFLGNVLNSKAVSFYKNHGVEKIESAFESPDRIADKKDILMFNKHCIRYELEQCPRYNGYKGKFNEPWYLVTNSKKLQLEFDCKACEMRVLEA